MAACLSSIEETAGCIRDAGIDPAASAEESSKAGNEKAEDRFAVAAAAAGGVEHGAEASLAEELRKAEEEVARVRWGASAC